MVAKKACKKCSRITDLETCPTCKSNQFSQSWQGRIIINNPEHSRIAKELGVDVPGEYALKVR